MPNFQSATPRIVTRDLRERFEELHRSRCTTDISEERQAWLDTLAVIEGTGADLSRVYGALVWACGKRNTDKINSHRPFWLPCGTRSSPWTLTCIPMGLANPPVVFDKKLLRDWHQFCDFLPP
jgi:hypothetical protein